MEVCTGDGIMIECNYIYRGVHMICVYIRIRVGVRVRGKSDLNSPDYRALTNTLTLQ